MLHILRGSLQTILLQSTLALITMSFNMTSGRGHRKNWYYDKCHQHKTRQCNLQGRLPCLVVGVFSLLSLESSQVVVRYKNQLFCRPKPYRATFHEELFQKWKYFGSNFVDGYTSIPSQHSQCFLCWSVISSNRVHRFFIFFPAKLEILVRIF